MRASSSRQQLRVRGWRLYRLAPLGSLPAQRESGKTECGPVCTQTAHHSIVEVCNFARGFRSLEQFAGSFRVGCGTFSATLEGLHEVCMQMCISGSTMVGARCSVQMMLAEQFRSC